VADVLRPGVAAVRDRDRDLVRLLLPAGLAGIVLGTLSFGLLSAKVVAGVVGALTLAFLAAAHAVPAAADAAAAAALAGRLLAVVSGFTSFVAHAGGPPLAFYVLPLKLSPWCSRRRCRSSSPPSTCRSGCPTPGWA
jgi:uncharacterized membrane protein YfcA